MDFLKQIELQEKGDAEVFAELFKDKLVYDHEQRCWYIFNGHVWQADSNKHAYNLVERVAQSYEETIKQLGLDSNEGVYKFYRARINTLRRKSGIKNTLELASAKLPLTKKWDNNPYLLAVKNGVLDLKTGKLRAGLPQDYIRRFSPVEWKGDAEPCERWMQFLNELFPKNPETIEFLQRMFGYAISGLNVEHIFSVFIGARGRNGKDVLLETLCNVLGENLASPISKEVLLSGFKNPGASAPYLYELQGKRLVFSDETNEGAAFDAAQIKMLSGGAPFVAKRLYAQPTIIQPQYLIVITTNNKPSIDASDDALWERLVSIEFEHRFVDNPLYENEHQQDKFLKQKLAKENSGILAWLAQGFLQWQEKGLSIPESVQYTSTEYRTSQDSLGRFLQDECIIDGDQKVNVTKFYDYYVAWANSDGVKKLSRREFSRKICERFTKERFADGYFYLGVCNKLTLEGEMENYLEQLIQSQNTTS